MTKIKHNVSPALARWRDNRDEILETRDPAKHQYDQFVIDEAKKLLARIPTGQKILNWIEENNVEILMDHQVQNCGGYILPGTNAICIKRQDDPLSVAVIIAHEARHVWQDQNGFIASTFASPNDLAAKVRLIEADAYATELRVLYEFEKAGLPIKPDKGLENLHYMMRADKDADNNGALMWAGFYAFFKGHRKDLYDVSSASMCILGLKRMLKPDAADAFQTLSGDFMPKAGFLADVKQGVALTKEGLMALSIDFDGKGTPYLHQAADLIIEHKSEFMGQFGKTAKRRLKHSRRLKRIADRQNGKSININFPFYQ